ncbi:hypothetical protein PENSPDRAFT_693471 [Peniophora sp. CONT]|nr:hypothetical protein PENSPDRAFT_693471 [Peniophora sp. CONT]
MSDVCIIDDLPPELLDNIFIFTLEYGGPRTRAPSSAGLSHVCRRWRTVALACNRLWATDLPYRSLDWTELCLSRCPHDNLELNIVHDACTRHDPGYQAAVSLVLSCLDRVRCLRMRVEHGPKYRFEVRASVYDILCALRDSRGDYLTDMAIEFDDRLFDLSSDWPTIPLIESIHLMGGTLQSLKSLPSTLMRQNLRRLSLHNVFLWRDIDTAISCLQAVPMLEHFSLSGSGMPAMVFNIASSKGFPLRAVPLTNMKCICLHGSWAENMAIFNHISIPPRAQLNIGLCPSKRARWELYEADEIKDLIVMGADTLRQHFSAALARGAFYRELEITMCDDGPRTFTIAASPRFDVVYVEDPLESTDDPLILPSTVGLSIPWVEDAETCQNLFDIFSTLDIFTNVQILNFDPLLWVHHPEVYMAYPCVRSLKLVHENHVKTYVDGYSLNKHATVFPALDQICFIDVHFDDDYGLLLRVVEHLLAAHPALKRIEFRGCNMVDHVADQIRGRLGERRIGVTYSE